MEPSDTVSQPEHLFFESLCLPESASAHVTRGDDRSLGPLAAINLIVGPNNSGKSRLLRELARQTTWQFRPRNDTLSAYRAIVQSMRQQIEQAFIAFRHIEDADAVRAGARALAAPSWFSTAGFDEKPVAKLIDALEAIGDQSRLQYKKDVTHAILGREGIAKLHQMGALFRREWERVRGGISIPTPVALYIPILRGLRRVGEPERDLYLERTRLDYFSPTSDDSSNEFPIVFTGLSFFSILRDSLLGPLREREFIARYQRFLSVTFFDGEEVALIPRLAEQSVYMKVGREKEQPIHELGDGLQQLLIMTLPLFTYGDKDLLMFVEEPEHCLHPGAQRTLLEAFKSAPGRRQVFLTTHSNHLLDSAVAIGGVSLFRVEKQSPEASDASEQEILPSFLVEAAEFGDLKLLEDLGVRASSVFLTNRTVWVEGVTDWRYLERFIRIVAGEQGAPTRGLDYEFVEYGGANLSHWDFSQVALRDRLNASRVCSRMIVVADRDRAKAKKHERLRDALKERYLVLPVLEVENLLSPAEIFAVLHSYGEDPNNLRTGVLHKEYKGKPLGRFIDSKILRDHTKSPRFEASVRSGNKSPTAYAAPSGTLKAKVEFQERLLVGNGVRVELDITMEAVQVAKQLLEFIRTGSS